MTTWGEDYVTLAFRVEKYFEGFIDGYCGPESLKARIQKEEKQPLDRLFEDAAHLYDTVPSEDRARKIFLQKQMVGIKTTIQVLQGEEIDYADQVNLFFDITPQKIPDSTFERKRQVLEDIFKRKDLHQALDEWRKEKELSEFQLTEALSLLHTECQKRTHERLTLPEGEHADFVLVKDKPWGGYNWYLGNYASRVEINTDIPMRITGLPTLVAHESYPGHHTEHTIKEKVLYHEKGFLDAAVFVYNTPDCLISEGIGEAALTLIFQGRAEAYRLLNTRMHVGIDVERDVSVSNALEDINACNGNASLMIHQEHADKEDVVEYLVEVGLSTRERAEKQIEFMTHPLFRAYIFTYLIGKEVVLKALGHVDPRTFYENQVCPSNLECFT